MIYEIKIQTKMSIEKGLKDAIDNIEWAIQITSEQEDEIQKLKEEIDQKDSRIEELEKKLSELQNQVKE